MVLVDIVIREVDLGIGIEYGLSGNKELAVLLTIETGWTSVNLGLSLCSWNAFDQLNH